MALAAEASFGAAPSKSKAACLLAKNSSIVMALASLGCNANEAADPALPRNAAASAGLIPYFVNVSPMFIVEVSDGGVPVIIC
jgi:hypothetical protein